MVATIESLKEQAQYLNACLDNLRRNIKDYPDIREAKWLESLMESSLAALANHIAELEKLGVRPEGMPNTLYK